MGVLAVRVRDRLGARLGSVRCEIGLGPDWVLAGAVQCCLVA